MWTDGTVTVLGVECEYRAKVYDEPSKYGIDNGRISKLAILCQGRELVLYDRGWVKRPQDDVAQYALCAVLELYS